MSERDIVRWAIFQLYWREQVTFNIQQMMMMSALSWIFIVLDKGSNRHRIYISRTYNDSNQAVSLLIPSSEAVRF
jgi:hypothetical protein